MPQRDPSRLLLGVPEKRPKDIFPSGFDSISSSQSLGSSSGSHSSLEPGQLFDILVTNYKPDYHVEHLFVTAAWYGKQTKSARHEFILIEVQDKKDPKLRNFMILDRNNPNRRQVFAGIIPCVRAGKALDAFRISYDGNREKLLEECKLSSSKLLESLDFSTGRPLHLYELVTLVQQVSNQYPSYHLITSSCYQFSGLIWDCMRSMRPCATYNGEVASLRGKFVYFNYKPEPSEVEDIKTKVQEEAQGVKSMLQELSLKGNTQRGRYSSQSSTTSDWSTH